MKRIAQFLRFLTDYENNLKRQISLAETYNDMLQARGGAQAVRAMREEYERLFYALIDAQKK